MLGILKITCEIVNNQQAGGKFDSQIAQPTGILSCKTHKGEDCRSDSVGGNQSNVSILDYFRSCANIDAEKEANISIMKNIHDKFND